VVKQRRLCRIASGFAVIVWMLAGRAGYAQNTVVVPVGLTNVEGATSTDIPFVPFNLSLMQYIPAGSNGLVPGLNVGDHITGLRYRLDNGATPPGFTTGSSDYEIYLSQGQSTPPSSSLIYSNYYIAGTRQQVRDGRLVVPAGSFPSSASGTTPEDFGPTFGFGTYDNGGNLLTPTDFIYQGGSLVYEIRYLQYSERILVDFESGTPNSDGFILLFNSVNAGSHLAATAEYRLEDYAIVTGFVTTAAVPEPGSVAFVLGAASLGYVVQRQRKPRGRKG
jgi:hypothetical protein